MITDKPDLVFSKDTYLMTPLHWAALYGHKDMTELLLMKQAEINAADNTGRTPLFCAVSKGHIDVADLLLSRGADVNARPNGETPLDLAAMNGNSDLVELLRQHGALPGKNNLTVLVFYAMLFAVLLCIEWFTFNYWIDRDQAGSVLPWGFGFLILGGGLFQCARGIFAEVKKLSLLSRPAPITIGSAELSCPRCTLLNPATAARCDCGFNFSSCARCCSQIVHGQGYLLHSDAIQGVVGATGRLFMSTSASNDGFENGDRDIRPIGAIRYCEGCASLLFTNEVWKVAKPVRIEMDPEHIRTSEGEDARTEVIDFSVALAARRKNLGPEQARKEAAQLWQTDQNQIAPSESAS